MSSPCVYQSFDLVVVERTLLMSAQIESSKLDISNRQFLRSYNSTIRLRFPFHHDSRNSLGWRVGCRIATRSFYNHNQISIMHSHLPQHQHMPPLALPIQQTELNAPLTCAEASSFQHYRDRERGV